MWWPRPGTHEARITRADGDGGGGLSVNKSMTVNFIMHVEARAGAVTRVGIATREPISMVISRRPIIEYAKYVYAGPLSLSLLLLLPLPPSPSPP